MCLYILIANLFLQEVGALLEPTSWEELSSDSNAAVCSLALLPFLFMPEISLIVGLEPFL